MTIRLKADHNVVNTATCGQIREVLRSGEYPHFDLAIAVNLKPTKGHYHRSTEEVYFVMDGWIKVRMLEPGKERAVEHRLEANELVILRPGTVHRIIEASDQNRLCVLSVPRWSAADEYLSEQV